MAILQRTTNVDLLLTDIDLKDVIASGIELAQDAVVRWPNLKVLYTTGRDLTDGMKAAVRRTLGVSTKALHSGGIAHNVVGTFQDKPAATAQAQC